MEFGGQGGIASQKPQLSFFLEFSCECFQCVSVYNCCPKKGRVFIRVSKQVAGCLYISVSSNDQNEVLFLEVELGFKDDILHLHCIEGRYWHSLCKGFQNSRIAILSMKGIHKALCTYCENTADGWRFLIHFQSSH